MCVGKSYGHLDKDHKGNNTDVGKILHSYHLSPACDSCLQHPSVPDSPSPRNKSVSYSLWTFITDLQIPPWLPRWSTQLLSLLSHPPASPFQSILTPLTLQGLCLSRKGVDAGLHSNLWEGQSLCPGFHNNHRDLLLQIFDSCGLMKTHI